MNKRLVLHPEFPAFRQQLAPLKAARQGLSAIRHLHDLEAAVGSFFPAALLRELRDLPGCRLRWLPRLLVFWSFLSMVLNPGMPCREAQRAVQSWWMRQKKTWRSTSTNAFCAARARLPLPWLQRLQIRQADQLGQSMPPLEGCHGRRVLVVDGTSVLTPDTAENQACWPQSVNQKPGCGFPQIRLVALFCLTTGALLRAAHGSVKKGEARLFALLRGTLKKQDVLVADSGFYSFANLSLLARRGVDLIVRTPRITGLDWSKGHVLGPGDRLITLTKSQHPSSVMSCRLWKRLPRTITVRQVKLEIQRPGVRPRTLVITTTLLDPVLWPASLLLALFERRWRVELYFDDIKTTMGAETMRCLSPGMVRRELLLHAIAYNLVRRLMRESSRQSGTALERISFKGTVDTLRQWQALIAAAPAGAGRAQSLRAMFQLCGTDPIPERPGRAEPRAVKRRPKCFPRLTRPRAEMVLIVPPKRRQYNRKPKTKPDAVHKSWLK